MAARQIDCRHIDDAREFGCLRGGAENWVDEGGSPG
jgi:hypothetical protein